MPAKADTPSLGKSVRPEGVGSIGSSNPLVLSAEDWCKEFERTWPRKILVPNLNNI